MYVHFCGFFTLCILCYTIYTVLYYTIQYNYYILSTWGVITVVSFVTAFQTNMNFGKDNQIAASLVLC